MPSDRYADALKRITVELLVDEIGDGITWTAIPAHEFFQGAQVELLSKGVATCKVTLMDAHGSYLEALATTISAKSQFKLRFGYQIPGLTGYPPTFQMRVSDAEYHVNYTGFGVTYHCIMAPAKSLHEGAPATSDYFIKAGTNVPELFKMLAAAYGWVTRPDTIYDGPDATTAQNITWHAGETPVSFAGKLAAATGKGVDGSTRALKGFTFALLPEADGFVAYFLPEKAFDLMQGKRAIHKYTFGRSALGDVIDFQVDSNALFASYNAAQGAHAAFLSPSIDDGAVLSHEKAAGESSEGAKDPALATSTALPTPANPIKQKFAMPGAFNSRFMNLAIGKWYDYLAKQCINVQLQVVGTHDVQPFDYLDVQYLPANAVDARPHFLSNTYRTISVTHDVTMGNWTTSIAAYSENLSPTDPNATNAVKASSTVTPGKVVTSP